MKLVKLLVIKALLFSAIAFAVSAQEPQPYTFESTIPVKCPLGLLNCSVEVTSGGSIRFAQDRLDPGHKFSVYLNTPEVGDQAVSVPGSLVQTGGTSCSTVTFTLTITEQPLQGAGTVSATVYLSKYQKSYGRSTACQWQINSSETTVLR